MDDKDSFDFSIIALIYRSSAVLIFFYFYVLKYTPEIRKGNAEFYFVANNANRRIKFLLKFLKIKHFVFDSPVLGKEEMLARKIANPEYLSRVYAAYNFGVAKSRSNNVVLVNSDMIFSKNWLPSLGAHAGNLAVSSNLVERNHPKFSTFPGAIQKNFGSSFATFRFRSWNNYVKNQGPHSVDKFRSGGSYMPTLFNKHTFEALGGYHEGNLGDGVDINNVIRYGDEDFFFRLKENGVEHITDLGSFCYHFKEGERETSAKVFVENRIGIRIRKFKEKRRSQVR